MNSEVYISVVIPNCNNAATIGKCLESAFSSDYRNFEVIVVDDFSEDNSIEVIKKFPSKLICLEKHAGASRARNIGAQSSNGDFIFFTDADCILKKDTLSIASKAIQAVTPDVIIGGTYTKIPYDKGFFSMFQSVFINYSETKKLENPDYIATHAMIINARTFRKSNGFPEDFLPILEDVEFSHRLREKGYRLKTNSEIQVQHIFNFTLIKSLRNAVKKSWYWTMYSLKNKDSFADSGTASVELKINVVSYFLSLCLLISWLFSGEAAFLCLLPAIIFVNSFISRGLLRAFYETNSIFFAGLAFIYYTLLYPAAVIGGVISGIVNYLLNRGELK